MLMRFGILQCNVPSTSRVALVGWAASREKGVCCGFCCSISEFLLLGDMLYFGKVIVERSYKTAHQQGIISSK